MILVLHFNHFTGRLEGGYRAVRATKKRVGASMSAAQVLAFLAEHPDTRCEPLKV